MMVVFIEYLYYSFVLAISVELFILFGTINFTEQEIDLNTFDILLENMHIGRLIVVCFCILTVIFFIKYKKINFFDVFFRYRYWLGVGLISLGVIANISGSSIGLFDKYLPEDGVESGVLFGHERMVRVDEWQKSTPMAFSQEYNKTGRYPYYSDTLRGCETDAFIVYGQPAWNPLEIFRPFHWGYLIFGSSRGLAFYWITRLVALFLVSIEFFMLLTDKNKRLSVIGAVLVVFSPIVQWWYAINGFVEMLFFGEFAIVCLHKYLNITNIRKKAMLVFGISWCAGGYFLSFYPAWQVPFIFVFAIIAVWVIKENYKQTTVSLKIDGAMIILFLGILVIFFSYLLYMSADTIKAMLNTAYPGKRSIFGGGGNLLKLFVYPSNVFLPLTNVNISVLYNESEAAKFFDFFPLGILMAVVHCLKTRKIDLLDSLLIALGIMFTLYMILPWPKWLASVTLMKFCSEARVVTAIGYINILLLLKNLTYLKLCSKRTHAIMLSIMFAVCTGVGAHYACGNYMNLSMIIISMVILGVGGYFIVRAHYKGLMIFSLIIIMGQGLLVNPVQQGIKVIYDNPLTQAIYKITKENEGIWITDNISTPLFNLPIMVGAPTINSINIYPNLELWHKLDKEKKFQEIYNRQAHIGLSIIEEETYFELKAASAFMVYLNVNDIEKIGVRFVLSSRDLTVFSNENIRFLQRENIGKFYIFEIIPSRRFYK